MDWILDENLDLIRSEVKLRTRFDLIDFLLEKPTDSEIRAAIEDAVADVNHYPPHTNYTADQMVENHQLRRVLYVAAAKNAVRTLHHDWTENGFDASIGNGELSLPSKLSDVASLYDSLKDEFETMVDTYKRASLKIVKGVRTENQGGILERIPFRGFRNRIFPLG